MLQILLTAKEVVYDFLNENFWGVERPIEQKELGLGADPDSGICNINFTIAGKGQLEEFCV